MTGVPFPDQFLAGQPRGRAHGIPWRRRSRRPARSARKPRGGPALHSSRPLLQDLATVTCNVCRTNDQPDTRKKIEFELGTLLSAEQARALELLNGIRF